MENAKIILLGAIIVLVIIRLKLKMNRQKGSVPKMENPPDPPFKKGGLVYDENGEPIFPNNNLPRFKNPPPPPPFPKDRISNGNDVP